MAKNHYDILGVKPTSVPSEIRSAYRKLVLKLHPDQSKDPRSKELFIEVVKAYEVLSDPVQRRSYDRTIAQETARAEARLRDAKAQNPKPKAHPTRHKAQDTDSQRLKDPKTERLGELTVEAQLTKLADLYHKGRLEEAERLAYYITVKHRSEALPYAILGDIARSKGDSSQAVNMYAHAVQAAPDNAIYQHRYEELARMVGTRPRADIVDEARQVGFLLLAAAICLCACSYIALSNEMPLMKNIPLVSSWSLALLAMTFLGGLAIGVCFSLGGLMDRFHSVSRSSAGRLSPSMTIGALSVLNFWLAAALYFFVGQSQNAFNYSTSRLVGGVACFTLFAAGAAKLSSTIDALQVFLWAGNLAYIGALSGWLLADAFRIS